jgi:exopolyphosphatase/guanosine-5'-triphosphate,3'-diphosphate pyrophosphatase
MPFAAPRDAAVIDIGSNSVRLVVYRLEGRAIWTVFNEKVLAGLGRDLGDGGRLSPEGVAQTLAALKRFRAVLEAVKPRPRPSWSPPPPPAKPRTARPSWPASRPRPA